MLALVAILIALLTTTRARADYYAVCNSKDHPAEWRGPNRARLRDAKKDVSDHDAKFRGHAVRIVGVDDDTDSFYRR
jgi:hypothetical protein